MIFIKQVIYATIRQIGEMLRLAQHISGHHNSDKGFAIHSANTNAIGIVVNNLYGHSGESNHYLPTFASSLIMHVLTNAEKLIPRRDAASLAESRRLAGIRIVTGTTSPLTRYERISVSPAPCSIKSEYAIASYTFNLQYKCNNCTPAWEQRKLGEFLILSRVIGHTGVDAKKLTVKLWGKGVVEKTDSYGGSKNTQYYIRRAGQLMYGKLDFLHAAFGLVPAELDGYESTLDSPAFDLVNVDGRFLLDRITQESFYLKNGMIANGSRKAKRIHEDTFLDMPLALPTFKEQQAIGTFFSRLDDLITLHQRKRLWFAK